jgi:hypothetical protein
MQHFGRAAGTAIKGMSRVIPQRGLSTISHAPTGLISKMATYGMAGATALGTGAIAGSIYSKQQELERLREKGKINNAQYRRDMENLAKLNRERENKVRKRRELEEEEELGIDFEGHGKRRSPYISTVPVLGTSGYYEAHNAPKTVGHGGSRRKHRGKTHRRKNRKNRKTRRN